MIGINVFLQTDTDQTVVVFMFECVHVRVCVFMCLYVTVWVYVCMCWVTDAAGVSVTLCQACKPSLTWSAMALQVPQAHTHTHTHTHNALVSVFLVKLPVLSHSLRLFDRLLLDQYDAAVVLILKSSQKDLSHRDRKTFSQQFSVKIWPYGIS